MHTVLDGKHKAMRLLRIYSYIFQDNIKIIFKEISCKDLDQIYLE
jgi:hypothetical protein